MSPSEDIARLRSELGLLGGRDRRAILNALTHEERAQFASLSRQSSTRGISQSAPVGDARDLSCFSPWLAAMIREVRDEPQGERLTHVMTAATRSVLARTADEVLRDRSLARGRPVAPAGNRSLLEVVATLFRLRRG